MNTRDNKRAILKYQKTKEALMTPCLEMGIVVGKAAALANQYANQIRPVNRKKFEEYIKLSEQLKQISIELAKRKD